jgi:hypothetical protein
MKEFSARVLVSIRALLLCHTEIVLRIGDKFLSPLIWTFHDCGCERTVGGSCHGSQRSRGPKESLWTQMATRNREARLVALETLDPSLAALPDLQAQG